MAARGAALATEPAAEEAADAELRSGGGAVGAVIRGYLTTAGRDPGTLLAPLVILVGGIGQAVRVFDGRALEPGRGTRRPRGFQAGESIPDAARLSVPTALSALSVAHAYAGGGGLSAMLRAASAEAERVGARGRARLLARLSEVGAAALTEPQLSRALLRVGSTSEKGLLTPRDLEPPPDLDLPARAVRFASKELFTVPWEPSGAPELGPVAGVCAVDRHGVLAAACFFAPNGGLWIEELDLWAPALAVPVRRGVERVSPGTRLPSPAPIGIVRDAAGHFLEVVLDPARATLGPKTLPKAGLRVVRDPTSQRVTKLRPRQRKSVS